MIYGAEDLTLILLNYYSNSVGFVSFMREMTFSFGGLFNYIIVMAKFYIFAYGWQAITVMVAAAYLLLMLSKNTRPLATLMLNEIFKQPFSMMTGLIRGMGTGSVWLVKFIVSAIRNTKG